MKQRKNWKNIVIKELSDMKKLFIAISQCVLATVVFYIMIVILSGFDFSISFISIFFDIFPIVVVIKILNFLAGSKKI